MKKINNKGFILAETLVVSIFLTLVFTMIYSNFYPLVGEYEKRELYDDVDGKYAVYWIKRMIESDAYVLDPTKDTTASKRIQLMNNLGYMRFECDDVSVENNQREMCKGLVNLLEVSNCDKDGNGCDIFITRYQLGSSATAYSPDFKQVLRDSVMTRKEEFCYTKTNETQKKECYNEYFMKCCVAEGLVPEEVEIDTTKTAAENGYNYDKEKIRESYPSEIEETEETIKIATKCRKYVNDKVFNTATKDYVLSLPNYSRKHETTNASYRVLIVFHHTKDDNDFYSFSQMEVNK